jgi:hypothetical protein
VTDPVVFFYNEVVRRLTLIRGALSPPISTAHSNIQGASAKPLFSRDHFDFLLCHVFQKVRQTHLVNVGDCPIIWRLKASARNEFLGAACLFMVDTEAAYQAAPVEEEAANATLALYRRPTVKWRYSDTFFNSIHCCFKECPLAHVLVGRLYVSLVCQALNDGAGARTVRLGHLKKAAADHRIGDTFLFSYFWSSDRQMNDFINTCNKKWKMLDFIGLDDADVMSIEANRGTWRAVLRGLNETTLFRRIEHTAGVGNPVPVGGEVLDYEMVSEEFDAMAVHFDRNLRNFTLGEAIKKQKGDFVITLPFLNTLVTFRADWMTRRNQLQNAMEDTDNEDERKDARAQCISHSVANFVPMKKLTVNNH